jgi:hypothetical protein
VNKANQRFHGDTAIELGKEFPMVIVLLLAILALVGSVAAVITTLRDDRGRIPTVWGYSSRHPLP